MPATLSTGAGARREFFYGAFAGLVVLAAAIVLIPHAPLGVITTAVQALAGVLLPSATVFLLLLCNDEEVLGPWVNRPWLNAVAFVIVSVLLMMSLVLMATTVFPGIDVKGWSWSWGRARGHLRRGRRSSTSGRWPGARRRRPCHGSAGRTGACRPSTCSTGLSWSRGRLAAMYALRVYLVVAVVLLLVKAIELGLHG